MLSVKRPLAIVAAAVTAGGSALAITGVAGAKAGEKSFGQTYPRASTLCAHVAAGGGPKALRPSSTQVLADCKTLEEGFEKAHDAVVAEQGAFATGLAADQAAIAQVCTPPVPNHRLCRTTRHSEQRAIRALRRQHRAAVRLYYRTAESNRRAFWAAIHILRGGAGIPADAPIPQQSS